MGHGPRFGGAHRASGSPLIAAELLLYDAAPGYARSGHTGNSARVWPHGMQKRICLAAS